MGVFAADAEVAKRRRKEAIRFVESLWWTVDVNARNFLPTRNGAHALRHAFRHTAPRAWATTQRV